MKFIKALFLPIHYTMAGFSFTISSLQEFLCNFFIKLVNKITGKVDTKIQRFFEKQKKSPENLLLVALYAVTIISLINIFVPKDSYTPNNNVNVFTYENVSTVDNDNVIENNSQPESGGDTYYSVNVDFNSLIATNPDTVAYIIVEDTNISYPVVQTDNNDFYLERDFNKNYSQKGAIFADYRNDFNNMSLNTIIYGHHRLDNTMFGPLDTLFTEKNYKNGSHRIILKTLNKTYVYNIFSVYEIDPEIYYLTTSFNSDNAYLEFLNTLKSRSIYQYPETLDATSKILTLSTCNLDNTGRLVVHAKLVEEY